LLETIQDNLERLDNWAKARRLPLISEVLAIELMLALRAKQALAGQAVDLLWDAQD